VPCTAAGCLDHCSCAAGCLLCVLGGLHCLSAAPVGVKLRLRKVPSAAVCAGAMLGVWAACAATGVLPSEHVRPALGLQGRAVCGHYEACCKTRLGRWGEWRAATLDRVARHSSVLKERIMCMCMCMCMHTGSVWSAAAVLHSTASCAMWGPACLGTALELRREDELLLALHAQGSAHHTLLGQCCMCPRRRAAFLPCTSPCTRQRAQAFAAVYCRSLPGPTCCCCCDKPLAACTGMRMCVCSGSVGCTMHVPECVASEVHVGTSHGTAVSSAAVMTQCAWQGLRWCSQQDCASLWPVGACLFSALCAYACMLAGTPVASVCGCSVVAHHSCALAVFAAIPYAWCCCLAWLQGSCCVVPDLPGSCTTVCACWGSHVRMAHAHTCHMRRVSVGHGAQVLAGPRPHLVLGCMLQCCCMPHAHLSCPVCVRRCYACRLGLLSCRIALDVRGLLAHYLPAHRSSPCSCVSAAVICVELDCCCALRLAVVGLLGWAPAHRLQAAVQQLLV
jgi:hypothetical protein